MATAMTFLRKSFCRWFLDHPASLNETYWEHLRIAFGFGGALFRAGAACLIHAVFPASFTTAASRSVDRLHGEMFGRRNVSGVRAERSLKMRWGVFRVPSTFYVKLFAWEILR
jgi:Family of unknown function (DUF6356)